MPPSFRDPRCPVPGWTLVVRPAGWSAQRQPGRLVLVTLGTVFAQESGDLFARLLDAVRDLPVDVLFTVGPAVAPSSSGRSRRTCASSGTSRSGRCCRGARRS